MEEIELSTKAHLMLELVDRNNEISKLKQELDKLKEENYKLTCHKEMQDLTIEKLYGQLNNPQTSFTSNGYLQSDLPKTTLTYICWNCNEKDKELDKCKSKEKELRDYILKHLIISKTDIYEIPKTIIFTGDISNVLDILDK